MRDATPFRVLGLAGASGIGMAAAHHRVVIVALCAGALLFWMAPMLGVVLPAVWGCHNSPIHVSYT